jgi:hypothetical protein
MAQATRMNVAALRTRLQPERDHSESHRMQLEQAATTGRSAIINRVFVGTGGHAQARERDSAWRIALIARLCSHAAQKVLSAIRQGRCGRSTGSCACQRQ